MARKPRSDAKLLHLPLEQQAELCEWLLSGMPYALARAALLEKFKVQTSTGALHDFYHAVCAPELLRQRANAVSTASDIVEEVKASPGEWTEATLDRLGQMALEMMLNPSVNAKDVKAIFSIIHKSKDQALEERKVTLQEQKALQADAAKGIVGDGALTAEEKDKRLKQIFRMG